MRLTFESFDGKEQIRVAHGDDCVILLVEDRDYHLHEGVVMTAKDAAALGRRLIQQAKAAQDVHAIQRGEP